MADNLDADIDAAMATDCADALEAVFRTDPDFALDSGRAWSRGAAMFLARRLGPAPAYEIAARSADEIITTHAAGLAVPNIPPRRWRRPDIGTVIVVTTVAVLIVVSLLSRF